jgi:hypothetical protein
MSGENSSSQVSSLVAAVTEPSSGAQASQPVRSVASIRPLPLKPSARLAEMRRASNAASSVRPE